MINKASFALLALAVGAVELTAQVSTRERVRDRVIYGDGRTGDVRTGGGIGDIIFGRTSTGMNDGTYSRVPKGHLPPRGMCRVWIDGVPPGHQPPVTSCSQAERDRLRYSNARVIYGDVESFPGKGKYKKARTYDERYDRQCSIWDTVILDGRQGEVCRDGEYERDRNGRVSRRQDVLRDGVLRRTGTSNVRDDDYTANSGRGKAKAAKAKARAKGKGNGKGKGGR